MLPFLTLGCKTGQIRKLKPIWGFLCPICRSSVALSLPQQHSCVPVTDSDNAKSESSYNIAHTKLAEINKLNAVQFLKPPELLWFSKSRCFAVETFWFQRLVETSAMAARFKNRVSLNCNVVEKCLKSAWKRLKQFFPFSSA